ncbi:MAG: peptidoglycan bridge formation glycyltransferase FemA/FemB family protein [Candidatus Sungbacteria bacterium]|nr:peptidoglycan bridge formation glycyltransferase FemA/FemB family protein [Candidatus Sungbacteria bacterium]
MSFLQSPEWQEIQERLGRITARVRSVLVIVHKLPFGLGYLYAPRPRLLDREFINEVERWGRDRGSFFLKVDPEEPFDPAILSGLISFPSFSLQPRAVMMVDCRKSEAEFLSAMHPKTRYNIRLAERHGVSLRRVPPDEAVSGLDSFWELAAETSKRNGFSLHSRNHYGVLLGVKSEAFENQLWLAEYRGKVLAAAIINFYRPSGLTTYLHGASSGQHREVMASYLLHWGVIKAAKQCNFARYDFGGIDEKRWPGVTRFKKGFGGVMVSFPESRDFVFRSTLYWLYYWQRRLRYRR